MGVHVKVLLELKSRTTCNGPWAGPSLNWYTGAAGPSVTVAVQVIRSPTSWGAASLGTREMVLGTVRFSNNSSSSLQVTGLLRSASRRARLAQFRAEPNSREFNPDWNHMIRVSFSRLVCDRMKRHRFRRADRAPGRCRAGGGLLGGKDPAGRFIPSICSEVAASFSTCRNFPAS